MKTRVFRIGGMSCAACSNRIEGAVGSIDGVQSVVANFGNNTATVTYDETRVSEEDVAKAVTSAGYTMISDDREKAEQQELEALRVQKRDLLISILFAIPLSIIAMGPMFGLDMPWDKKADCVIQLVLFLPIMYSGRRFYKKGFPALLTKSPTMDSLVALSTTASVLMGLYYTIVAFASEGDASHIMLSFDSAGMIIALVSVGKYMEARSKHNTNDSLRKLLSLAPSKATVIVDGKEYEVDASGLVVGDLVLIRPGESVPADGVVVEGSSAVNESMLTGESIPVSKTPGSVVYGATVNGNGSLKVRIEKTGDETVLFQIARMMEMAQGTKAPVAHVADRVAAVFVPAVIIIAALSAVIWFAFGLLGNPEYDLEFCLTIAISVLVISCPCALGLATPLAIVVGTGNGSKHGILFKTAASLEAAANVDTVVLDKTGTITKGHPTVTRIITGLDERKFISIVASAESDSEHPIAEAIVNYAKENGIPLPPHSDFEAITGQGIVCKVDGQEVLVGNRALMDEHEIPFQETPGIMVAIDGIPSGSIVVSDPIRDESPSAVRTLKEMGIEVMMVTGDRKDTAEEIAKEAGITEVIAETKPQDKLAKVKELQVKQRHVAMTGDGINDAPALTQSDVGLAVGSGTDIAIESADIVLMNDDLRSVPAALEIGRATLKNIKQNLFFALVYNAVCIPIAAGVPIVFGLMSHEITMMMPMFAAAAMSLSSISVVSNALRMRRFRPRSLAESG
jgi:Cu+-exporting ATPase